MSQNPILTEVKKAIDFWFDKTYDESAFYSHILAIIRDNSQGEAYHRDQIERLIFKIEELREKQRKYWNGDRSLLKLCKQLEKDMDQKIMALKLKGYDSDRFKARAVQNQMFK